MNMLVKIFENFLGEHKKHNEDKCQVFFITSQIVDLLTL